jgi:hypothetical protein
VEQKQINYYFIEFSAINRGVIATDLDQEGAMVRMQEELDELYGETGWELKESHVATVDEINEYNAWMNAMNEAEVPDVLN